MSTNNRSTLFETRQPQALTADRRINFFRRLRMTFCLKRLLFISSTTTYFNPSKTFSTFILLAICIFLTGAAAFAQTPVNELEIRVKDTNGAIINGANIILKNIRTGLERQAVTGAEGKYVYRDIENAGYEISVLAPGFTRASKEANPGQKIDIVLQPAGVNAETTVYSGSRQEELRESLNTKVDVLTSEDIRDTGYETVGEVLREVPGVITRRGSEGSGAGEQIQGIDSRQVLVLFDGFPVIGARGIKRGVINLDRQSTDNLQQVEVVKGASSALFGSDAIGGVINMIPREQTRPFDGDIRVSGGNFGVFDAAGMTGFVRDKLSGIFTLERHKRNEVDLTPTTFDTTIAGFHRTDFYNRFKYQFTRNFSVSTLFDGYWNRENGRSVGEQGNQFSNIKENSQSYGLIADWQFSQRGNLQLRGYFSRWDEISLGNLNDPSRTALPDGNLFERLGFFDGMVSYVVGERQLVQFGGELRTNRYRGINRLRDGEGNQADTRNVWAQDKISITNRLTATLGLRFGNHSVFGSAWSPKAGLNFRVNNNINLRASWGRGFRAPDLGQLYYRFLNPTNLYQVIGNPNLSPEHSGSWQAGGEYHGFNGRFRFGANFYRNDVRNLIDSVSLGFIATQAQLSAVIAANNIDPAFNPVPGRLLFYYKNLSNIYTQGAELDTEVTLPKGFAAGGAYTYLDARDKTADLYLLSRSRHQGFVKVGYTNPRLGFRTNLRGTFYSSFINARSTTGVETIAPGFQMWDLYAAKSLPKKFEIYGSLDNIFDNQDPNTGRLGTTGTPLPIYRAEIGRSFRIGLRWVFGRDK